tara:strand:- start:1068 stop:1286 length:219 start_codon:yes stop_codon:yes gene_type:complete
MKKIGGYFAVIGIALIVLPYFGLTIRFLDWIDNWGDTVSWAIKIGLILVGAVLFFMGKPSENDNTTVEDTTE